MNTTTNRIAVSWRLGDVTLVVVMMAVAGLGRADDLATPVSSASVSNWPGWRGPGGRNVSPDDEPPLWWSVASGVEWTAPIPGRGHASPSVDDNFVFIASADEESSEQLLLALDRRTGRRLWQTVVHRGPLPVIHEKNSHASATPVCHGGRVYTLFAQLGALTLSAIDYSGQILWQRQVGRYEHANGLGASPAVFRDLVIVANDNPTDPSIVAFATDGSVRWRVDRKPSENSASPVVAHVAGVDQLLINGAFGVHSYSPLTGVELWRVEHSTEVAASTMAFDDQLVAASGNVPEPLMLVVDAGGTGDVTDTHILWSAAKENPYVPSPLVVDQRLLLVTDGGVASCRDLRTGRVLWKKRLGGNFSASPVLAANHVYAINEDGVTYVFRTEPEFELVARNDLGQRCLATPAMCGNRIFVRTEGHLYCIRGAQQPAPQ